MLANQQLLHFCVRVRFEGATSGRILESEPVEGAWERRILTTKNVLERIKNVQWLLQSINSSVPREGGRPIDLIVPVWHPRAPSLMGMPTEGVK